MNIDTVKAQENLDEPEKAFELDNVAVRLVRSREPLVSDEPFSNPDSVVRALSEQMRDFDREVLGIINLDSRMRPINVSFVSAGAVNGTLSHPREILKAAILSNAASMMLIHNHPSGYLIPSKMDVQMTDRMIQLCDMVNIPLMDHIIVGGDKEEYFSFSSQKVLPEADNYFTENYLNLEFTMRPERQDKELPDDYNGLMPVIEEPQAAYNREDRVKEITQQLEDGMAHDLEGNINDYLLYIQALKEASGVPIHFEEIDGDAHGYYNRATDSIAVKSGMSESQTVKTMIHEIAHSILHNDNVADAGEKNRRTKEVEAESVAYTVCKHFGIDTSDYSFGYIAGWSADKELSELKASLETIRKTSSGLITGIEEKLEKLRLDKDMNVSEQASENVMESRPNVTESHPNVTESVTGELQHSRDMMIAALGSTGDLLSSYENKASGNVTESVTVVAEEKAGYESRMPVRKAIENREHTYHSAYADIGMVLDNYTTDELIEYLKNNEPGGESSLRNYVESQIIGAQINRERYQSENNIVTESVTKDMPDEPDIKQVAGMRI